ncbi:hypothetical protein [Mobilicoccus caccae]|uniref:Uncharacterized protein n=1 Tax=Mobilicoccus caccae TaxID=1859295 RepID=A0ABQ6IVB2_9MICO|nr:hypothetical protein [Mobilicoccus caccae]GMA40672.1 hypothetical protein GCM10025883_27170 [Mobilicoccus caccae]
MSGAHDPIGSAARTELDRLTHRWHTLPVGQARSGTVHLRALASELLGGSVDDLGPATALDQVRVGVYEAARAGADDAVLGERLAHLRRTLAAAPHA